MGEGGGPQRKKFLEGQYQAAQKLDFWRGWGGGGGRGFDIFWDNIHVIVPKCY